MQKYPGWPDMYLKLNSCKSERKDKIIRMISEIGGRSLTEAQAIVDGNPSMKDDYINVYALTSDKAWDLLEQFNAAGANVSVTRPGKDIREKMGLIY